MTHSGVNAYLRYAALVACIAIGAACHRQANPGAADDRAAAQAQDSARAVLAERSRSSASQVVDFTDEQRSRFTRVEIMIQTHFPGVQVVRRGCCYSFKIRGGSTFSSNSNEPLVLVDGAARSVTELDRVNTKDVTRIEVVKDGAAAFYGVRGANGVILITTRRTP